MTEVLPERRIAPLFAPSSAEAAVRIESWLLHGDAQLTDGPHRGGVAGWLTADGDPDFVYLEITGYYLTAMAWLAAGAATTRHNAAVAVEHVNAATDWIAGLLAAYQHPPTRLYVSENKQDWRNDAVFTFDLAMAARGLAQGADSPRRAASLVDIAARLDGISSGAAIMQSHQAVADSQPLQPRWSTRSGPHHLKAAAAVLCLPNEFLPTGLAESARRTRRHWTESLRTGSWPCAETHALLYGIEGMLVIAELDGDDELLDDAAAVYARLMTVQAADGTLPEYVDGGIVRSDVLAQALRAGLLLRGRGRLAGAGWERRLDLLADALCEFVQPTGGVAFARHQNISNTWCAMFAHQALYLHARHGADDATVRAGYRLLV